MAAALILRDGQRLPLAADQRVGLTVQANDILKTSSVQSDYSNTLTLADTPEVRAALQQPQHGLSLSDAPYQQLPCTLEAGNLEVLPNAVAVVEQHETGKGFEAQVLGGNKNFYAAIEGKKLRELAFPYNTEHDWVLQDMAAGAGHTDYSKAYVYDLYDRGKGGPAQDALLKLYEADIYPSLYVRAVWQQIFNEAHCKWTGPMPALFDRLLMPSATAPGYSEEFRKARRLLAGINGSGGTGVGGPNTDSGRAYEGRPEVVRVVPFDDTPARYGYVAPTTPLVWNPAAHSWKALEPCYVNINASLTVELSSPFGSAQAQLFTYVNGQEMGGGAIAESKKGADSTYVTVSTSDSKRLLKAGDEVTIKVKLNKAKAGVYGTHKWGYTMFSGAVYVRDGNALPLDSFSVEVLPDFPPGGRVRLQDWLPDMSQKDFVKGIIGLFGLTQQTDPYTRTITFSPTGPALQQNAANALDWTHKLDASEPAPRLFHLSGQAQQNWFRWKEDDSNPDLAKELGDGMLPCPDQTLDAKRDALVLPWAATTTGTNGLLLLPVYKARVGTVSVEQQFDTQNPVTRLVVQTGVARRVKLVDGTTTVTISPLITTFGGLDFATSLLPAYYTHLAAAYRRPLVLKPAVRLRPDEVTDFNQLVPVWLESEGAIFYANKLDNWEADQASTVVELIRLTY
ncbi:hypothetical protein [Hymenobacter wooponensis]|uniref:Uncharacterized protein n=1 Tax=Hymenobacter wooponensis TaxID=1525360 RepID=A0A4Z0MLN3_9BACT|nr:hypothetical protein [Hymenobacter wooponensis]TGD80300.1 hypothetical protein EU557_10675 [Hymenobacter wooponensis]